MKDRVKIGFDIRPLETQLKAKRGIGQSTYKLAKILNAQKWDYEFVFCTLDKKHDRSLLPGANLCCIEQLERLPALIKANKISLMHFNDYFHPLYLPKDFVKGKYAHVKTVVTIYDLIPFYFQLSNSNIIKKNLLAVLDYIDILRANSIDTKNEFIKMTGISSDKIEVIYHGIDHEVFHDRYPQEVIEQVKTAYGLKGRLILQVAAMEWRKNQIALLKAFNRVKDYCTYNLVFVGGTPSLDLIKYTKDKGLTDRVKFMGLVPDDVLPKIYNAAELFVFPSFYEGFGNPPLEAMACGLPVISSSRGSLKEILGDSPIYINPEKEDEIADAIYLLFKSPEKRQEMEDSGLLQAKRYSWEDTALKLVKMYGKLIHKKR